MRRTRKLHFLVHRPDTAHVKLLFSHEISTDYDDFRSSPRPQERHISLRVWTTTASWCLSWAMEQLSSQSRPRHVALDMNSDLSHSGHARKPPSPVTIGHRTSRRKDSVQHPKPPLTPNTSVPASMPQAIPNPLLPSAPASPPTPAPSPTPQQQVPMWHTANDDDDDRTLRDALVVFSHLDTAAKAKWLASIVDTCDNHSLSFLHRVVSPRLKKDPFKVLPNEICFKVGCHRAPLPLS